MGALTPAQAQIAENVHFFDRIVGMFPVSYYAPEVDAEGAPTEPREEAKVVATTTPAASLSELRERLQAKVQSMKQPRKENDENTQSKRKKKDGKKEKKPTEKKQKAASEENKQEGGKGKKPTVKKQKAGGEAASEENKQEEGKGKKPSKKQKKQEKKNAENQKDKQSTKKQKTEKPANGEQKNQKRKVDTTLTEKESNAEMTESKTATKTTKPTEKKAKKQKVALGQDLMFSSVTLDKPKESLENLPGSSKKNAHRAMRKVLNFEKRVQELKQDAPELAREVVKQASFSTALNRVQGIKVHDDKARLAKALKRKEKSKQKSQKEWSERNAKIATTSKQAAQKRNDNVKAKIEEKNANRLKKSIKKRGDVRALLANVGS